MKKITILSAAYPLRGGIAHFAGLLYKELLRHFEVDVITFKRQYPTILFPGKTQLESGESVDIIPTKVEVDSLNPINWIRIGNRIKNTQPDFLILKYWMPFFAPCYGVISRLAKRNGKTKIVAICHNVIPHEKKPGDLSLTKFFFSSVDKFVLLSGSVKRELLNIVPNAKYRTLFHPIYSNFGDPVSKETAREYLKLESKNTLLFFGFIREYKGLDVLLQAAAELKTKLDFQLIIAGEFYSNEDKYRQMIKGLDLESNVILFSDFIPQDEVRYYFSACDVVVLPYKSATQSGIVQIANNFVKPMISTNVGGLSEVIIDGKNGYLVEKKNPTELAKSISKYFLENKEVQFSENIRTGKDRYSWTNFTNELITFAEN